MYLSSCHRDIGIPINFQQESGIITFEALNTTHLSRYQKDVCLKEVHPLVVYDGEQEIALETMQWNGHHLEFIWASLIYFTFLR